MTLLETAIFMAAFQCSHSAFFPSAEFFFTLGQADAKENEELLIASVRRVGLPSSPHDCLETPL